MRQEEADDLPPPVVPAEVYTSGYYTTCCAGHEEWVRSGGAEVAGVYQRCLEMAAFSRGEVVVDVGTGRGELLAMAVRHGAARAVGVEYALPAVELARTTLDRHGVHDRAEVIHADARRIPLEDGSADLVTMLDVVEHLAPVELEVALAEVHRLLRPGGRVFIHTMPNREIYEVTYRWLRRLWPGGRRWPEDPRNDMERLMHVNEQTRAGLLSALRSAGFVDVDVSHGQWIWNEFVPDARARRVYGALERFRPTRRYGAGNLFAIARR